MNDAVYKRETTRGVRTEGVARSLSWLSGGVREGVCLTIPVPRKSTQTIGGVVPYYRRRLRRGSLVNLCAIKIYFRTPGGGRGNIVVDGQAYADMFKSGQSYTLDIETH